MSCNPDFHLSKASCFKCDDNEFFDVSRGLCLTCSKNCLSCDNISSCKKCQSSHLFDKNSGSCVFQNICTSGKYLKEKTCENCLENCQICINSIFCQQCKIGFKLNHDFSSCLTDQNLLITRLPFIDKSNLTDDKLLETKYNGNDSLIKAVIENTEVTKELFDSNCFFTDSADCCKTCRAGYYLNSNDCLTGEIQCLRCPVGCVRCFKDQCFSCKWGFELSKNNTCISIEVLFYN